MESSVEKHDVRTVCRRSEGAFGAWKITLYLKGFAFVFSRTLHFLKRHRSVARVEAKWNGPAGILAEDYFSIGFFRFEEACVTLTTRPNS